jgi:hypothetical protein
MIPLRCACGERLQPQQEYAGLPVCPACGRPYPSAGEPPPWPKRREGKSDRVANGCMIVMLTATVLGMAAGMVVFTHCHGRNERDRTYTADSLKQLALAIHFYHDVHKQLPTHAIYSKDGKPLLSWRVTVLPYVEQKALYQQFKLDEPWDSPHNIRLLEKMPKIYAPVRGEAPPNTTRYQVFTGPKTPFKGRESVGFRDFAGGTSKTILIVEADEPVPWTKPADLKVEPGSPLPPLGGLWGGQFYAAMGDGSVRFIARQRVSDQTLRLAIDPSDGQALPADF